MRNYFFPPPLLFKFQSLTLYLKVLLNENKFS